MTRCLLPERRKCDGIRNSSQAMKEWSEFPHVQIFQSLTDESKKIPYGQDQTTLWSFTRVAPFSKSLRPHRYQSFSNPVKMAVQPPNRLPAPDSLSLLDRSRPTHSKNAGCERSTTMKKKKARHKEKRTWLTLWPGKLLNMDSIYHHHHLS